MINTNKDDNLHKTLAIYGLRGILKGIQADEELSEMELTYLNLWLHSQESLSHDSDVDFLIKEVKGIKSRGHFSHNELERLLAAGKNITQDKALPLATNALEIQELMGFLGGIVADNHINPLEISQLQQWLKQNEHLSSHWATELLNQHLTEILADGIITIDEQQSLLETCQQLAKRHYYPKHIFPKDLSPKHLSPKHSDPNHSSKHDFSENDSHPTVLCEQHSTLWSTNFLEDHYLEGLEDHSKLQIVSPQTLCFAGDFLSGTKSYVEAFAKRLGATVVHQVNHKVDLLIIGYHHHEDWRLTQLEQWIEKAVRLREKGHAIKIWNEQTWIENLTLQSRPLPEQTPAPSSEFEEETKG